MHNAITDVPGIAVGHADDLRTLTGCTVVLCDRGATVGVDVRGPAPGTRETDLCRAGAFIQQAHGVLLTGGSAFGLEAAGGVMRYCYERGIGVDVGVTRVPIIPAAVIFDLALGSVAWPDAAMGYAACLSSSSGSLVQGCVGAGVGATVGKLLGKDNATKSGIGSASVAIGSAIVGALVVVNALGNVVAPGSDVIIAGARGNDGRYRDSTEILIGSHTSEPHFFSNTTIGVIATDAALTKEQANHLASVSHNGLARTILPVHTMHDGDTMFCLATGTRLSDPTPTLLTLAVATVLAVERAIVNAVRFAVAAGGLPAAHDLAR
jgi:L-aminopeptidase/D-esterase-like protein